MSGSTNDSLPTHSATTFLVPSSELSKWWNSTSLYNITSTCTFVREREVSHVTRQRKVQNHTLFLATIHKLRIGNHTCIYMYVMCTCTYIARNVQYKSYINAYTCTCIQVQHIVNFKCPNMPTICPNMPTICPNMPTICPNMPTICHRHEAQGQPWIPWRRSGK